MTTWLRFLGITILAATATGCAATGHRDVLETVAARSAGKARTTLPRQVHVSLPADQPDLFEAIASQPEKGRLTHYFPGLRPKDAGTTLAAAPPPAATKAKPPANLVPTSIVATSAPRPSLFGSRKPKTPRTYMTDARTTPNRADPEPSLLPVALQLPTGRSGDRSVTPTSMDLPGTNPEPAPTEPKSPEPKSEPATPSNPDASDAPAPPPSTTEPQLAVAPMGALQVEPTARPEPAPTPADNPSATDPATDPAPAAAATATIPERPEPERSAGAAPPGPTSTPATAPTNDVRAVKAGPSPADPSNSLGLPPATLPASYSRHDTVAVRGSNQAPEPPPVLASPQVEASPQSPGATANPTPKSWRRPCLRRLIRRMGHLGEFANPPTAQPH